MTGAIRSAKARLPAAVARLTAAARRGARAPLCVAPGICRHPFLLRIALMVRCEIIRQFVFEGVRFQLRLSLSPRRLPDGRRLTIAF